MARKMISAEDNTWLSDVAFNLKSRRIVGKYLMLMPEELIEETTLDSTECRTTSAFPVSAMILPRAVPMEPAPINTVFCLVVSILCGLAKSKLLGSFSTRENNPERSPFISRERYPGMYLVNQGLYNLRTH